MRKLELELIEGYWTNTETNNRWDASKFSKEEALRHDGDLVGCKNCTDCISCSDCSSCTDCKICYTCVNCQDCTSCWNCDSCSSCDGCEVCWFIGNATDCKYNHDEQGNKQKIKGELKMNLIDFLKANNLTTNDIDQVYFGKDHACRCGCRGDYSDLCNNHIEIINNSCRCDEIEWDSNKHYVNLPVGDPKDDWCYCIYFKKNKTEGEQK